MFKEVSLIWGSLSLRFKICLNKRSLSRSTIHSIFAYLRYCASGEAAQTNLEKIVVCFPSTHLCIRRIFTLIVSYS